MIRDLTACFCGLFHWSDGSLDEALTLVPRGQIFEDRCPINTNHAYYIKDTADSGPWNTHWIESEFSWSNSSHILYLPPPTQQETAPTKWQVSLPARLQTKLLPWLSCTWKIHSDNSIQLYSITTHHTHFIVRNFSTNSRGPVYCNSTVRLTSSPQHGSAFNLPSSGLDDEDVNKPHLQYHSAPYNCFIFIDRMLSMTSKILTTFYSANNSVTLFVTQSLITLDHNSHHVISTSCDQWLNHSTSTFLH